MMPELKWLEIILSDKFSIFFEVKFIKKENAI